MVSANRYQEILLSVLNGTTIPVPTNRDEAVLITFLKEYSGSGNGSGTTVTGVQSVSINEVKVLADSNKNVNIVADTAPVTNSKNLIISSAVASHTNNTDIHVTLEEKAVIQNLLHNKGFFLSEDELNATYSTGEVGDYATVLVKILDTSINTEKTDLHMFIWDDTQNKWVDTNIGGMVTSINGKSGDVVLDDLPYDNAISGLTATTFKNALDEIVVLVQTGVLLKNYLTKEEYASEFNEGSVKLADKAKKLEGTELAKPFQFFGIDSTGKAKFQYLPLTNDNEITQGNFEQRKLMNVTANNIFEIASTNKLDDCKVFVQAYKVLKGQQDVTSIIKSFSTAHKDEFYCSDNVEFMSNGCDIRKNYNYSMDVIQDYYISEEIDSTEFINGLELG